MKIIAVLNQKGGSGKTTISTNIAHAIQLKGFKVLLVDSDPQGSARDWNGENQGELVPVIGLDRETLAKDLKAVQLGYDFIVIDGAPQIAKLSAEAVKIADFILIPCQPSPYDVWATDDLVDLIKTRQSITDGKPKAGFVISRAIKNTKLSGEVIGALGAYDIPILKSNTTQLIAYPTSASKGGTVFTDKAESAKKEIISITDELLEALNHA